MMKIASVFDPEFAPYGTVLEHYDTAELCQVMQEIPMPKAGVAYEPSIHTLENCGIFDELHNRAFGGMPIQVGMCWGYNTKLNCLEYHRDSELNLGCTDFVLLLAKKDEIRNGKLDTACVKAFAVPAGVLVEVYATSLHYAPCRTGTDGFRVAIVLPKGTNTAMPEFQPKTVEDRRMTACNKWLLAHPDAAEARTGAYIGITGNNLDITQN